jgi:DNA-binding transcriptional LysR family regulator
MTQDNLRNVTLQQMEALIHLVEERSFSAAAKKMFLTQPSLTKHVKNMEEAVGARIVNRESRGVTLTPEGKILYDYARRIIVLLEDARDKIARVRENQSGDIYIGASTIPATYILPILMSAFRRDHPEIRLHVRMGDSDETIEAILNSHVEIGFIGKKPPAGRLEAQTLWKDKMVLAAPASHPWARGSHVRLAELSKEPLVVRERGSATREALENCLKENGLPGLAGMCIAAELGSSEAVKEAVLAGLGVSVLSAYAITRELRGGLLVEVPLRGCKLDRHFYLIRRRHFNAMQHHRLFLDFVARYRPTLEPGSETSGDRKGKRG